MTNIAAKREEVKSILRGLLISSPRTMTADQLHRDYKGVEGQDVPYRQMGHSSFIDFLLSIPDTVVVRQSGGGPPVVTPVTSAKTSHVDALVQKQKITAPKRSSRTRPNFNVPLRRTSVRSSASDTWGSSVNTNIRSNHKQKIVVPHNLQQRIYKMVYDNPQGVPVRDIEQEVCTKEVLLNFGIDEGIYQLLTHLGHLLKVSNGVVYPIQDTQPVYKPAINKAASPKNSDSSGSYRYVPAGFESTIPHSQQNGVHSVNQWNINEECDMDLNSEYISDEEMEMNIPSPKEEVSQDYRPNPLSRIESVDSLGRTNSSRSPSLSPGAFSSDFVSEQMRRNFRMLLDKYPGGIWCSELPLFYKKEFKAELEFDNLGYVNMVEMVSHLSDIFYCVRPDGTDWKVFDVRKPLPSKYVTFDMKKSKPVNTTMVPNVPSRIKSSIERLLMTHPSGLPSDQFLDKYQEIFQTRFNIKDMGFDTLESFLLSLNDSVLHLRYVNQRILIYPQVHDQEPEPDNPLPHITESQDTFSDLYPPEVMGPKATIAWEKIPPEAVPGEYIEVLVAEVYNPHNFWIQLRGEKTHVALDKLMNEMQDFYNQVEDTYHMPEATIRVGQFCVAPYNEEYHRGQVTAIINLTEAQVLFVDYGTRCRVKMKDLRFMHMDFGTFPMQAFKAKLANLIPAGGAEKWPRLVSERFLDLVSDKNLIAELSEVDHEERTFEIALVDTTGNEDVHINDVLKREGLADYGIINRFPQQTELPQELPPMQHILPNQRAPISRTIDTPIVISRPPPPPPPGFSTGLDFKTEPAKLPVNLQKAETQPKYSYPVNSGSQPSIPAPANVNPPLMTPAPAPSFYDMSLMGSNPYLAQATMIQSMATMEQLLQRQQLLNSFMMSNPFAMMMQPHLAATQLQLAAALSNTYASPLLNPALRYTPNPISERLPTNVQQPLQVNISEVEASPPQNSPLIDSPKFSPNTMSQPLNESANNSANLNRQPSCPVETTEPVSAQVCRSYFSAEQDSSQLSPNTPKPTSSTKVDHTVLQMSKMCIVDVPSEKQSQGETEVVGATLSDEPETCFEYVDHCDTVEGEIQETDNLCSATEYETDGAAAMAYLGDPDDVYRSDDEDEEETEVDEDVIVVEESEEIKEPLPPHRVREVDIAGRIAHILCVSRLAYVITDEVIRLFTEFSGRHVILKILDSKRVSLPFAEAGRRDLPDVFQEIEMFDVAGVSKSGTGQILGKLHLMPLSSVPQLLTVLNIRDSKVLHAFQEESDKFNPYDVYWTGT